MDSHELAYIAGVVDSDGSIGIKRSTYAMRVRGDATQAVYSETIHIKQVQPEAVELAKRLFGGNLRLESASLTRGKPLWSWMVHSAAAGRALTALLPYLRIKRRQAENAFALRAIMGNGRKWPVPCIVEGEPLITATEFARLIGANRKSVLQSCSHGSIPSVRVGRSRLMPLSYAPQYTQHRRGPPRDQSVTAEMQRLYERGKELNQTGI